MSVLKPTMPSTSTPTPAATYRGKIGPIEVITGSVLCLSTAIFIANTVPWWPLDSRTLELSISLYLLFEFGWKIYTKKHQSLLGKGIDFMSFAPGLAEHCYDYWWWEGGRQMSQRFVILRMFRMARLAKVILGLWPECELALDAMYLAALRSVPLLSALLMLLAVGLVLSGSMLYAAELPGWDGRQSPLNSIPIAVYSVVEMVSTVGLGDMAPITPLGRLLGCFLMMCAMALVAFPSIVLATNFQKVFEELERKRRLEESDPLIYKRNQEEEEEIII